MKKYLAIALAGTALLVPVMVPAAAHAEDLITGSLSCGAEGDFSPGGSCQSDLSGASTKVSDMIKLIINILSVIVGVVAVIMIIFGGLKYITSGGDSSNVSSAKNTIIYAIVGLVIVALAQFIVRFVLDKSINGANSTP